HRTINIMQENGVIHTIFPLVDHGRRRLRCEVTAAGVMLRCGCNQAKGLLQRKTAASSPLVTLIPGAVF
ncbi:MAG: hypothetical protein ACYC0K_09110, partial [Thermoleophilia bacterium]